jgi:ferredoxin
MLCWTPEDLGRLIAGLREDGRAVIGPMARDGVIVYDEITSLSDLPTGWTDEQAPGRYRLARRNDEALFGFTVGPHSWKPFFLPARLRLWLARRSGADMDVVDEAPAAPPLALVGVRACELAAIAVQDRALAVPGFADPHYAARRKAVFIVAVECGEAHGTCFCASMGTGPRVSAGCDLVLTELMDGGHRFVVRAASEAGHAMLRRLGGTPATPADIAAADALLARTTASMGRTLDTDGLPELLQQNRDSPRWEEVATRCLGCTSCTLVCPTCFCTTVEDVTDLAGTQAERIRRWDSCFALDFSYVFGGPVRRSLAARYRQWLTHKLSSWHAQYGVSGCVGCGRCITWCPAGIDITVEAAAIRAASAPPVEAPR